MPRTFITAERTLLAGNYNVSTRFEVKDSDGTWRDLTAYTGGRNFFVSATWTRGLDQPVMSGTVTLLRSVLGASLAPTIVGSIMNTDASSAYVPLLAGGRPMRLSTACTAVGVAPVSGDWKEMFLGRLDDPDWGGDEGTLTVTISDVGAWLLGKNIDTERTYSNSTGVALETVIQSILDDNVSGPLGAVTLYTPTSPSWNIRTFPQQKVNVLTAIRTLAQQIGWDVRFVYDASNVYRLTLFQPQRTKTVADYTITGAEYYAIPQLAQNLGDVRTRIGGSYVDHATGARLWRYVQSDAAHTNQYDVVYMEITEDASSNIDSATEMDKMLNSALSDLQDPAATQRVESSYFWLAELGDLVGWPSNSVHYDTTQKLAVTLIEHTLDASGETTNLTCAGKVAGNKKEWLAIQSDGEGASGPSLDVVATAGTTTYSIAWTGVGVELSINGGAYGVAPTSPITVSRPAAGAASLVYTFRSTIDGQTITDAVTVVALDKDTVTPDITVTPGASSATQQDFVISATDPSGASVPSIIVTPIGTTMIVGGVTYAGALSIASGTTVTVNRGAFGTVLQAALNARAALSGAGAETIQRSIANQVKTFFGPSLDVAVVNSATLTTIQWIASATPTLRINGTTATLPGPNPFSVSRPAAGSPSLTYEFTVTDTTTTPNQYIVEVITIPAIDKDTVTADITVTPSNPTATTQDFTVSAFNPGGGAAPSIAVTPIACTIVIAGTPYTTVQVVASGTTITAQRPAFGTTVQAAVDFRAAIGGGGGGETIQRSVPNQVKTSFGPTVTLASVPSATAYVINYTSSGTLSVTLNGSTVSPGSSPWSVSRPAYGSAPDVYEFTSVLDGQTFTASVTVLPQLPSIGSWTINGFYASNGGVTGPPYNQLDLTWSVPTGLPGSGITYEVSYDNGVSSGQDADTSGLTSAAKTFTGVTFASTPGRGMVTVVIKHNGLVLATKTQRKNYTI